MFLYEFEFSESGKEQKFHNYFCHFLYTLLWTNFWNIHRYNNSLFNIPILKKWYRYSFPDDEQLCHSFSFIVKMIPENDPCRIYVFETGLFEKENEIYFDFLPAINFYFIKSQTQAIDAGSKTVVDKITPDCFYGSHNMVNKKLIIFYLHTFLSYLPNWMYLRHLVPFTYRN